MLQPGVIVLGGIRIDSLLGLMERWVGFIAGSKYQLKRPVVASQAHRRTSAG
jgi:hypothetical protein